VEPDIETMTILESMPMMVITTNSSSNVKALLEDIYILPF